MNKKIHSSFTLDFYFTLYLILFVIAGYILFQYISRPHQLIKENFVSKKNEKLPQCACPIQVPPEEWQQTVRDVKEIKARLNDLIQRFNPIEKEFKSANAAEQASGQN